MALLQRAIEDLDGVVLGSALTFENVGDELPAHVHLTKAENHIIIVTFGSLEITGDPKIAGKVISAERGGRIVRLPLGLLHGLRALTPGASTAHMKVGQ